MRIRKRKRRKRKVKKVKQFKRGRGFIEHLQDALGMHGVGYY